MTRLGTPLLAGLGVAALLGCSPPESPTPREEAGSLALLDHLAAASFDGEVAAAWSGAAPTAATTPGDEFQETVDAAWVVGREEREGVRTGRWARLETDPDSGQEVLALFSQALVLRRAFPLPDGRAHRVTVRLRAMIPDTDLAPGLHVRPLGRLPELERGIEGERLRVTTARGTNLEWTAKADPSKAGWQELSILVPSRSGQVGLEVSLLPGSGGVAVDWLRIGPVTPTESLVAAPRQIGEARDHVMRRRVMLGQRQLDCLLLPAGGRAHFEVRVPETRPRLDLQLGVFADQVEASVGFEVQVDGARVERRTLRWHRNPKRDVFHPVQVGLERFAGQVVRLTLAVDGARDAVGLWGTPRLLGAHSEPVSRVLLVSVDTLRADALRCYGGPDLTPAFDRLSREGTRFEDCYSTSSYTLPAHASLLTGQYPLENGLYHRLQGLSPEQSFTLAAHLRQRGFLTAAFTGGGFVHPSFGLGHGFDLYDVRDPGGVVGLFGDGMAEKESFVPTAVAQEEALRPLLGWIDDHSDQPFLVFAHTFFTHNYVVEPEFLELVSCDCSDTDRATPASVLWERAEQGDRNAARHLHHIYLGSVAQFDRRFLAPLFATLERNHILDDTLLVLVSDHGEQFLEHGGLGHGRWVWNELVRVPWLLRGPGVPAGAVRDDLAQLVDVAPTVLSLLDLDGDDRIRGQALLGPRAAPVPRDALFQYRIPTTQADLPRWEGLRTGSWKVLRGSAGEDQQGQAHLYHLGQDPSERADLAAREPERTEAMLRKLDRWLAEMEEYGSRRPESGGAMSAELAERLQQLGYADE